MEALQGRVRTTTHCSANGSWRLDRLRPAASLAGLVTVTNAYMEQDTGFTRRRELPDGNATILFNLGDTLRVEHPAGTQTVFAPGTAFYSGPSPNYAVSETDRAQQGAQVMLTPLGARRLLGIPLSAVGDALTDPVALLGATMRDTLGGCRTRPATPNGSSSWTRRSLPAYWLRTPSRPPILRGR